MSSWIQSHWGQCDESLDPIIGDIAFFGDKHALLLHSYQTLCTLQQLLSLVVQFITRFCIMYIVFV